jgi:hypothetical protein
MATPVIAEMASAICLPGVSTALVLPDVDSEAAGDAVDFVESVANAGCVKRPVQRARTTSREQVFFMTLSSSFSGRCKGGLNYKNSSSL